MEGGRLRTRKNEKGKGNKLEQIKTKITKYYKRKGVHEEDLMQNNNKKRRLEMEGEDLTGRLVAEEVVEKIVSVGWELCERRKRARRKMWAWKSAGSIVDEILEVIVLDGKISECGTGLSRQLVGQNMAEVDGEPMDISVVSEVENEVVPNVNNRKIPECRNEPSMSRRPSVAMVVELDKGAGGGGGGGVVQQKLDCFLQAFPNLKKLEANKKQRKAKSKTQKRTILGGIRTSVGSKVNGVQKVKDIRDYFENLQTDSGTKRKMGVGGLELEGEKSIFESDHKRFKTSIHWHGQAAQANTGAECDLIGQDNLVDTEQPIRSDNDLNLGSIGHAAAK